MTVSGSHVWNALPEQTSAPSLMIFLWKSQKPALQTVLSWSYHLIQHLS